MGKSFITFHINKGKTIELVNLDCNVRILHNSIRASQIVNEFSHHLVCHSDYFGQKTRAILASDQLKVGNKYFLMPEEFSRSQFYESTIFSAATSISLCLRSFLGPSAMRVPSSLGRIECGSVVSNMFTIKKTDVDGDL
jgi:hypothetical protein